MIPKKPIVHRTIEGLRESIEVARAAGQTIGLVPTMGALHEGHLKLVDEAKLRADVVVATIFVNPTQFGPKEDLSRYPRDPDGDLEQLRMRGVDIVFTPDVSVIYPPGFRTRVSVGELTQTLCGLSRPDHFNGVTTVVSKLFNIVGACTAVLGRKDYQQLQVIKRMATDLNIPVEILGVPTHRERDGLAMSSRNAYLTNQQRTRALAISAGLCVAHQLWNEGIRKVGILREAVDGRVRESADSLDYVTAAHPDSLQSLRDDESATDRFLIAVAATFGTTRLIDNTVLGEDYPPTADRSQDK